MPYYITLTEQAERLADDLYEIAVLALEYSHESDFNKACDALELAIRRCERRKAKAGLVF